MKREYQNEVDELADKIAVVVAETLEFEPTSSESWALAAIARMGMPWAPRFPALAALHKTMQELSDSLAAAEDAQVRMLKQLKTGWLGAVVAEHEADLALIRDLRSRRTCVPVHTGRPPRSWLLAAAILRQNLCNLARSRGKMRSNLPVNACIARILELRGESVKASTVARELRGQGGSEVDRGAGAAQ
jgi:hypothetical protein